MSLECYKTIITTHHAWQELWTLRIYNYVEYMLFSLIYRKACEIRDIKNRLCDVHERFKEEVAKINMIHDYMPHYTYDCKDEICDCQEERRKLHANMLIAQADVFLDYVCTCYPRFAVLVAQYCANL